MSPSTIRPVIWRAITKPRLTVPKVIVVSAVTAEGTTTPVVESTPVGISSASTWAPLARCSAMREVCAQTNARSGPRCPVPSRPSITTAQPVSDGADSNSGLRMAAAASAAARMASSVLGGAATCSSTRTPARASCAATTYASPPLLPAPACTSTPCERRPSCVRSTYSAARVPALSMSVNDGIPDAMAW